MKTKMKWRKIIASVVVAAMSIAFIPKVMGNDKVNADVVKNQLTTCLGTSGISAPVGSIEDFYFDRFSGKTA